MQIHPNIKSEYGRLRSVMVGIARKMGPKPAIENCYDARSRESVELGTYPEMEDCMVQLNSLVEKLESLGVEVLRPDVLDATNQVFTRDIGFVIDDQFILPNVIEDRASEVKAINALLDRIPSSNIIMMPSGCYAEGGDVIVHERYVFVGLSNEATFNKYKTARTNEAGLDYLQDEFPAYDFKGFELLKSDVDPRKGSLHLDCAFQPLGDALLLAPHLFKNAADVIWIESHFGTDNIFYCTDDEAYDLHTNVFSIGPKEVLISAAAGRLKNWLEERSYTVHTITYDEIVKMGGLLRCSTMPLEREE
ncbi:MAG: amidinotransferase [Bacteroidetes bacterium]|nr:MAG: amidinotransferase [Bacteroidota bacterium]REK58859.1 MAG: amidinotransferase [Bacteroidota bacterium]